MSPWELDTTNPSKDYARAIKYRLKAKVDGVCITERLPLAATSKVYCETCLNLHNNRQKKYLLNRKKHENKTT